MCIREFTPLLKYVALAGASYVLFAAPAFAQTAEPTPAQTQEADATESSDPHADHLQNIVVTGFTRRREDVLSGTSVVTGAELTRELRTTIGETLARQPGVSATSFGPNASRPVLRGFQG